MHATDARYLKHLCPIFNKYIVCASGFNEAKKAEMKQLIEAEGGTYSGDLICGTTTHLITDEAKGAKYQHARLWKINVVKSSWVYDSVKAKYCQPEKNYQLESTHTSTPTDSRVLKVQHPRVAPEIDVSVISRHNATTVNSTKLVNETENVTRLQSLSSSMMNCSGSNATLLSSTVNTKTTNTAANKTLTGYGDLCKELNLIGKIKLTLFDGINVREF